ncbi:MAG: hypothetical protein KDA22_08755 [Phycisphaerales bacterium]|nr:hypothetical protein [Phycisphaerales bacterium]
MRSVRTLVLLTVAVVLGGCSPSFKGVWVADALNGKPIPDDGVATMTINNDGSFLYTVTNSKDEVVSGASGTWDKDSSNAIRIFKRTGDGPDRASGTVSGNKLMIVADGWAGTFARK